MDASLSVGIAHISADTKPTARVSGLSTSQACRSVVACDGRSLNAACTGARLVLLSRRFAIATFSFLSFHCLPRITDRDRARHSKDWKGDVLRRGGYIQHTGLCLKERCQLRKSQHRIRQILFRSFSLCAAQRFHPQILCHHCAFHNRCTHPPPPAQSLIAATNSP